MSRSVVPIRDLAHRLPTGGRIRIGKKVTTRNGKEAPASIDTFRFTSQNRPALDEIATLYGGTVQSWSDPKAAPGQFEVITDANEIRIALPPDPLGGTPAYELWSGGGRQRNCDGETCEMLVQGADGIDLLQTECICFTKGALECRLVTRLSVILPEIRFVGVWRIDTKSQNAAVELPGMVELIRSLQERGLTRGLLRIESRRQVTAGETRQFKVPVLGIDASVEALAAGAARLGAVGASSSAPIAELGTGTSEGVDVTPAHVPKSGPDGLGSTPSDGSSAGVGVAPSPAPADPDDVVVDAEIVEEPAVIPSTAASAPPAPHVDDDACSLCGESYRDGRPVHKGGPGQSKFVHAEHATDLPPDAPPMTEAQSKKLHAALRSAGIVGPQRHTWASERLDRHVETFKALSKDEANQLIDLLERQETKA